MDKQFGIPPNAWYDITSYVVNNSKRFGNLKILRKAHNCNASKYDISKAFKLSNQNIANIVKIQNRKGFRNDSEVIRFCLDMVSVLIDKELETQVIAKLLENTANEKG